MQRKYVLLLALIVVALIPYFIVCFYALPFADDFCYAWACSQKISFTQRFLNEYLNWSGRYSAHLLLFYPPLLSGKLIYYQGALFIALSAISAALVLFIRLFIKSLLLALITALIILLFYLCYLPQLTEGVYWYTANNYLWGNIFFILHLVTLITGLRVKGFSKIIFIPASALLLIFSIGFTEVAAAIIPAYYLLAVVVLHSHKNTSFSAARIYKILFLFFILSAIASAFVVFAPGNFVRSHQFADRLNLLHSVLYSVLQTARFIGIWLLSIPAFFLSLVALAQAGKLPDNPLLRFNYKLVIALIIFTVFTGAFIPYYATGILGQHRTINYVFIYFILLWLWALTSFSKQYNLHQKLPGYFAGHNSFTITAVCIGIMLFSNPNKAFVRDLRASNFDAYKHEFLLRQNDIIQHSENEIVPLKNVPESFKITDARIDSTWWVNKCMKYFYRDTKIELQ